MTIWPEGSRTTTRTTGLLDELGGWRGPFALLALMAAAMPLGLYTWMALINNFAVERAGFDGADMGMLHSVREIPGFLSFAIVFLLLVVKEQRLAVFALGALGIGTLLTGVWPHYYGLMLTCFLGSLGFHYYEACAQSLSLQWLSKEEAPRRLGQLMAIGSFGSLAAFVASWVLLEFLDLPMEWMFAIGGGITLVVAMVCWFTFPQFTAKVPQRKTLILRRRYWLYYAITFMAGARRQIFYVFASFLLVERFGVEAATIALIFLVNNGVQILVAPLVGRLVAGWGERRALVFEYIGLVCVFAAYAFVETLWLAVVLYVLDHLFFAFSLAIKTYFQKIADPADIAPTTGVAYTINHIAAVVIPVGFGLIWLVSPSAVFLIGAAMAGVSLVLSLLIPRHPEPGNEVVVEAWSSGRTLAIQRETG